MIRANLAAQEGAPSSHQGESTKMKYAESKGQTTGSAASATVAKVSLLGLQQCAQSNYQGVQCDGTPHTAYILSTKSSNRNSGITFKSFFFPFILNLLLIYSVTFLFGDSLMAPSLLPHLTLHCFRSKSYSHRCLPRILLPILQSKHLRVIYLFVGRVSHSYL